MRTPHVVVLAAMVVRAVSATVSGFDPKTTSGGVYADAAAFNRAVKMLFLGIGGAEGPNTRNFREQLSQSGITNVSYESPGTAHEWLTWRRCFREFAPRVFQSGAAANATR